MVSYQTVSAPVAGGTVHGGLWGRSGPLLLAVHGITANHMEFQALADQLGDDVRLLAPDLRGRGRSNGIQGEWSMATHARDLAALLDHLQLPQADLLLGHSMGGFVAAVAGALFPARMKSVLLVDGGLPVLDRVPWFIPAGLVIRKMLGPAMKRLDMRFESVQAYRDFWRVHPALSAGWSSYVERYVDYDLVGEAPQLRSGVNKEAILGDTRSMMADDGIARALESLKQPVRFLSAPRGMMDDKPLYKPGIIQKWRARLPQLQVGEVADVNHYTILIGESGARAVAQVAREMLGR